METVTATKFGEVTHLLEFAEAQARAGAYVMVMVSYEAAPAFDSALTVMSQPTFLSRVQQFMRNQRVPRSIRANVSLNPWLPAVTKDEYNESVTRIRDLIAAGDTYQVNYSFPLNSSFNGDPEAWYHQLRVAQQGARYSAYRRSRSLQDPLVIAGTLF